MYNMDKLYEAVAERGHVCVGLDTASEYIPEKERRTGKSCPSPAEAVLAYNKTIIDATIGVAACYKMQIAFYEEMGIAGLQTYVATLKYLREKSALVIGDIKRGDIPGTAVRYARAHFEGDFESDFVTLSPYLGMDSVEPWMEWAEKKGKGAFVVMRTSNRGRRDFEYLLTGGEGSQPRDSAHKSGQRLFDVVGDRLSELAAAHLGKYGYGAFGAVVGADPQTEEERREAAAIRAGRPSLFFLIPGYGAQGGAASDAVLFLKDGNGGVVNASRSILKAWQSKAASLGMNPAEADNAFAAEAARQATVEMRDTLLKAAAR